jgi:hypothetical protein
MTIALVAGVAPATTRRVYHDPHGGDGRFHFYYGDIPGGTGWPARPYSTGRDPYLAAKGDVAAGFDFPEFVANVTGGGVASRLQA